MLRVCVNEPHTRSESASEPQTRNPNVNELHTEIASVRPTHRHATGVKLIHTEITSVRPTHRHATGVKLIHIEDFKPADKTPYNYDKKPFRLDGKLELDVSFQDRTMTTDIYVKMDALEPLLLSKGLCRQLGKVTYHPEVNALQPPAQEVGITVSVPTVKV